jgi:hypothetical protein
MDFPLTKQVAEKYGHTPSKGWKFWMNNWAESNEKLLEDTLRGWITDDVENSLEIEDTRIYSVEGNIKPNVIYLLQRYDGDFIMYIPVEGEPIKNQGLSLPIYGYYFNLNKPKKLELRKHFKIKTTAVAKLHSPENTTYKKIYYGTRPLGAFSVYPDNSLVAPHNEGYKLIGYYEPLRGSMIFMNWTSNPLEE